ncbi:MAG: hydroxyethylthiazole kinase [Chryseobacterium sp.]|nr:hydroxyethylthiazole kinase [Candidatus Chryseobacterium enterohippi]
MVNVIWENVQNVRQKNPLVLNITNFVVMNNTANALLAIGASPLMSKSIAEISDLANISNSLVVNIGTLDEHWIESMQLATSKFNNLSKPWVLDPVGAGATQYRTLTSIDLLKNKPNVIRGNASEIMALANTNFSEGKGVDSKHQSTDALEAGKHLAKKYNAIICISGEVDYVISVTQIASIKNGHQMMTKVTGLGCTSTALIGAFIGANSNYFEATLSAVSLLSVVGELAEKQSKGPGSLQMNILDLLYSITKQEFSSSLQIEINELT